MASRNMTSISRWWEVFIRLAIVHRMNGEGKIAEFCQHHIADCVLTATV
jgi:hypothetical protein